MKRRIPYLFSLVFACCILAGCDVNSMSSLPEISRPYVGEYKCDVLRYGAEDMTERFESIKLNLKYGGDFVLSYESKGGSEGEWGGTYTVSPEGDQISLTAKAGMREAAYTFPIKDGTILIDYNFAGKLLHAEFSFPK